MVKIGGIYKHYKGKLYLVLHIGILESTLEKCVVYQAQYDDLQFGEKAVWIRSLKVFEEKVNDQPRFELVE